jgi:prophage tail gpP-like protein
MKKYTIVAGDTYELIARKQYGTETEAFRIKQANSGVSEPFVIGSVIIIPDIPEAPVNKTQNAAADNIDEVAMSIDGKRFRFWSEVRITRSIDSIDTIDFSAPFEYESTDFKNIFKPFSFKNVDITVGGKFLFRGTMVNIVPNQTSDSRTVQVSGYSKPGVLVDCNFPGSSFPNEFNEQTLLDIAKQSAGIYGINVVFNNEAGPVFERIYCDQHEKILSFLAGLAKQRNLIINSNSEGDLVFLKSTDTGNSVGKLTQGSSPLISVTPNFNPQSYYSHITGFSQTVIGSEGAQYTVKNNRLDGTLRAFTFDVDDTLDAETEESVKSKAGRMFANAISYDIEVATWRDPSGNLWSPNTTLNVKAPGAMIYDDYEFLVKSVTFTADNSRRSAKLSLVLPGAFSGEIPERLPWD